jgi:HK97 family phage prohead protease
MTDTDVELRAATVENRSSGGLRRIGGLGVPYGKPSRLLPGGFREVVENTALAKTLADKVNVVSRLEHHPEWLLGSTDAQTMRLRNDPNVGLDYEVDLPDTTAGNDTYALTKRGDLRSASMGFIAYQEEFRHEGATLVRHLISIRLTEISPTATPAYAQTQTALRHLAQQVGEDPDDIFELARKNELRTLFTRTDLGPPTPLEVAQRSENRGETMDPKVARQELQELADPGPRKPWQEALTELRRIQLSWYAPLKR